MDKKIIAGFVLLLIGVGLIVSGIRQKTIDELRDKVEFSQRNVIYQDIRAWQYHLQHIRKIYSFELSAINEKDKVLLYSWSYPCPIIIEDGYRLCIDINRIGTY